MKKFSFILVLGWMATSLPAQECSDLFFSEYIEGSGNNKGMEIYNPTGEIVPLGSYYVARYSNGNLTYESGGITQLQGFLHPYSTHFLVNGQLTSTETSPACDPALQELAQQLDHDYPAPTYMNGNDAIALFKDPVGNGDVNDFLVVDLFGIIGGGMQSSDEGWAAFTDEWVYKNIYEGDQIVGQDSTLIQHYIVPDSYYWIPWTSNHSLIRKPTVKEGVKTNPEIEFDVTLEWDTIPGGSNVWDSIGSHVCDCEATPVFSDLALQDVLEIYPNPASSRFTVDAALPIKELYLYDAAGRMVCRREFPEGTMRIDFERENLPAGYYHIRISHEKGISIEKVMIL